MTDLAAGLAKKVLVTGSEGFIGSHLVEELVRDGQSVRAFVQYTSRNDWGWLDDLSADVMNNVEIVTGDIRDPFSVREAVKGCEQVFHLAALIAIPYSYRAPLEYVQTNVVGTLNVVQAARDLGISKVIHTSTSEVYGSALYVPIDEKHPLQGQSPYSASKIGADKIAESYFLSFGVPVVTIRPFNTFGPRQSARALIPTVITQAFSREFIELGSLDPIRDMNFVKDTVRGFVLAAKAANLDGEAINLCRGDGVSIGALVEMIQKIMGTEKEVRIAQSRLRPEKSEVVRLIGDNSRAKERLGWQPRTSLELGLRQTVAWIQKNQRYFKPNIYNQ